MRLSIPKCPECGLVARGTIDKVVAEFTLDGDDITLEEVNEETDFDFTGNTDLDDQATIQNDKGESLVTCENGHEWYTTIED